ncbi:hypothetical protein [Burkholderia ubonensis]|uniref:hypothetical protein n=1 Tax=Burkholderia ubonensis TaxID=101571 RepID=UPI000AAEC698|nr:hypothetical protein [Burkholderia ubonensis]
MFIGEIGIAVKKRTMIRRRAVRRWLVCAARKAGVALGKIQISLRFLAARSSIQYRAAPAAPGDRSR